MANPLAQTLGGLEGYRGTTLKEKGPVQSVGPATHTARNLDNGLANAMRNFVQTGADAYNQYDQHQQKLAEERSNEIIRKLTPEQRREAIANGTLLYKDDARAMTLLRQKTGRNAAFEVDSEIQAKIQAGHFRNREDMEAYRQQRMADRAKSYAESAGINPEDPDYQRGFNTDIVQRNAGLYDLHSQFLSKNLEAQASIEARNDLTPLMNDPKFLGSQDGAYVVANYVNKGLETGEFPSDREAINAITMLTGDAIAKDGGQVFLRELKDKKIKVLGGETTVENLLGPEVYQQMLTKADTAHYERNAKKTENLMLGIANAQAQEDPAAGWQLLNRLEQENDWVQTGDQMTPQRQALIQAKAQMIEAVKRQTAQAQVALDKRAQADNRQLTIDKAYEARMAGESVSVDPKFLPSDDDSGKFTDADMANYAHKKMLQIDNLGVPDDQKARMKLALLKADYKDGPFQAAFQTLTQDAAQEWQAALIQGKPGDFKRLYELQRAYNQNPGILAQLYPESAGLMETLKFMGSNGLDPQILIDAERNKPKTEEERRYREEQWSAIKNDSATADILKYIPDDMEKMARSVFDAYTTHTGSSSDASKAVTEFLQKNTVTFTEKSGTYGFRSTAFHGMLTKNDLMVDPNNTDSWETGKAIIDTAMQDLQKDSVWGASGMSVHSRDGLIVIQNMTGSRLTISKDQLAALAAERQKAEQQERIDKAKAETQRTQKQYDKYMRGGAQ
ncbi:protein inside capsid C [Pseudomonas phage PCS4]|uniref:Protein inside capsid C n=1 Tax=Pseudomonas phage PCS4 TaxID=2875705 RepID=A0ABY3P9B7_9CAUD|nr:protein inside capsid C [Pseudomonas phage PCS4]UPW35232.1 protein inside capsid C [Pseudomonas phage PCS5]